MILIRLRYLLRVSVILVSVDLVVMKVFEEEGGYVNYFKDFGGEINFGILKWVYFEFVIVEFIEEDVWCIYLCDYW